MNLSIPKVKRNVCQFPVWFTSHLRHLIKCLRTLQHKYSKHPIPNNFQKLLRAQCSFQDASKVEYECSLVHNLTTNHDSGVYCYIKQLAKSYALPSELNLDSEVTNTDYSKAELFNKYFFSVFTKCNSLQFELDECIPPENPLYVIDFTESDVYYALTNLNMNKSTGIDTISSCTLKHFSSVFVAPLFNLFTTSLNTGIIPTEWKTHMIIAMFKANDKTSVKNYRPMYISTM